MCAFAYQIQFSNTPCLFYRAIRKRKRGLDLRNGVEGAVGNYNANRAYTTNELQDVLPQLLQKAKRLYYAFNNDSETDRIIFAVLEKMKSMQRSGVEAPTEIVDPSEIHF